MPIFEYKCSSCGTVSEFLVGVAQDKESIRCGSCGGSKLKKVFSAVSFTVKSSAQAGCACCGAHEMGASASTCEAMGCPKAV